MDKNGSYEKWSLLRKKCMTVFADKSFTTRRDCGQDACIDLIKACQNLDEDHENDEYYGDVEHGTINDDQARNIHMLLDHMRVGAL